MKLRFLAVLSAGLSLAGVAASCSSPTDPDAFRPPAVIDACETNTATVCGTWTLSGDTAYDAEWQQGSRAVIRIERFTEDTVVLVRQDKPGSTSAGMTAVYRGRVDGDVVASGEVTWTIDGQTFSGTWFGDW